MTDTISFPPLRDLPSGRLEARTRHLLSEIAVRPDRVRLAPRHRPRAWRLAWAAAVLVLVFAGVAYAAGFNPFAGISAADHPATSNDSLPASVTAGIATFNQDSENLGHGDLLPDSARLVRQLSDGTRFYTIATSTGELCLANAYPTPGEGSVMQCGYSLSPSAPITEGSDAAAGPATAHSYGLAMDGVTAVSFMAGGVETTVPVTDNVWIYAGEADFRTVTVHWADGSTQTLTYGR